ncbi:MAG: FtsQ-type POTRA domain-containing protein [Tissierellia bacterium]|nr:FtsQ-type POTRA domain-containing protein [Tissierellia bacterium]
MERKEPKRRKKPNHVVRLLSAIALIGAIFIFLFNAPLFDVTKIQVVGNEKIRTSEIIDAARISNGSNIFSLSRKSVADRILQVAYVKDVNIKKSFPNKVVIEVEERINTAAYRLNEAYYLIDNDGILLEISQEPVAGITIIGGLTLENINLGDATFSKLPNEGLETLLKQLVAEGLFSKFHVIMLGDIDHINFEMYDETKVEFGDLREVKYKVSFLKEILDDITMKGLKVKSILMDQGTKPVIVIDE